MDKQTNIIFIEQIRQNWFELFDRRIRKDNSFQLSFINATNNQRLVFVLFCIYFYFTLFLYFGSKNQLFQIDANGLSRQGQCN